jgi:N-acetylglutamate synthase-like GNAT family acetyltransferase
VDFLDIHLRKARPADREKVIWVESKSTPNLRYIPYVFDMFVSDDKGEFSVAEIDGEIIGCGKFTVLPDRSAWLETLRVIPTKQGLGVGKRFYERFYDIAHRLGIRTMRMYTGVNNVVSKGLAERYGFKLAESFRGVRLSNYNFKDFNVEFQEVTDQIEAYELLMENSTTWGGFLVMNRTFYKISLELAKYLILRGMVYKDIETESVIVLGARFMPWKQLHIGLFAGDEIRSIALAMRKALGRKVETINCLFPSSSKNIEKKFIDYGFDMEPSDFIVMETKI